MQIIPLLLLLSSLASASETIHGAVLFTRHGDRTPKKLGTPQLTVLGQNQAFAAGTLYRNRYLDPTSPSQIFGISAVHYDPSQIDTETPDSATLVTSTQAFLQGLYPPTDFANETLANNTVVRPPLQGFQYAGLHINSVDAPETIELEGDDQCLAYTDAGNNYYLTQEFNETNAATKEFYAALYEPVLKGVFNESDVSYKTAYLIFDYINYGRIHNASIAAAVNSSTFFQLRTLADRHEWGLNFGPTTNSSAPDMRSIGGGTLAGIILDTLNGMVMNQAKTEKLATFFGSYDSFLGFFGLTDLPSANPDFFGLPDYVASLAFEIVSYNTTDFPEEDDLWVRVLYRNNTNEQLSKVNIFPQIVRQENTPESNVLSWTMFRDQMSNVAVVELQSWCGLCASTSDFCLPFVQGGGIVILEPPQNAGSGKISKAAAGGIGAACALAVAGLVAAVAFIFSKWRRGRKQRNGAVEEGITGGHTKATGPQSEESSVIQHSH